MQMLELSNKYFKVKIIKNDSMRNYKYSLNKFKKENLGKEIEDIKQNQIEIIEEKNTLTEIKSLHKLNSRLEMKKKVYVNLKIKKNRIYPI